MNKGHLILLVGKSTAGKSYSLRNLRNPKGVLFLNCEAGKNLPFKSQFREVIVTDPRNEITGPNSYLKQAANVGPDVVHTVVIDSLTFLMQMYETKYSGEYTNGMKFWADYGKFFTNLINQEIPELIKAGINVILLAHTSDVLNEKESVVEVRVKLKGSVMNTGVEAYFNDIIAAKVVPLETLKNYKNDMLHLDQLEDEEQITEQKHVLQTKLTKESRNDKIRSSPGLWKMNETYVDGDIQVVLDHLNKFYYDI